MIIAGAGTGKTAVIARRIAYIIEKKLAKPSEILALTFTDKAAAAMEERVDVLVPYGFIDTWISTFHAFGDRILRENAFDIGLAPDFKVLSRPQQVLFFQQNLFRIPLDYFRPLSNPAKFISAILSFFSRLKDENVSPKEFSLYAKRLTTTAKDNEAKKYMELATAYEAYEKFKDQAGVLDFGDQVIKTIGLFLKRPKILKGYQQKFKYILVDEYQDTNYIQGEIINHLAGDDQNVLVVGDDSQSIYSFRGAVVENILDFPKNFSQTKTFKLEINYRSTPEILGLANESIRHNRHKFDKKLRTHKKSGERPALVALDSVDSQADFICQRILDLQKEQRINLNEIAVLFRAHFQSLELELAMNKRNIPYVMRGGLRFFEQAHIKDVVAYLRILANHLDEVSWVRILQLQTGIGPATVDLIWQNIRQVGSLKQILEKSFNLPLKAAGGWTEARNILLKLYSLEPSGLSALIETILTFGYQKMVRNNFENSEDRLADLEQLAIFADRYDSLDKFLVDTALGENFKGSKLVENKESILEAVILSTIHQAKGLEWKAVFIISLLDGQFPNAKAFDNYQDLEEERRMFYVASTRAQDQLYLTYPIFSSYTGQINQVSQFVKELPKNVYEKWKVKDELISEDDVVYVDEDSPFNLDDVSANFWKRFKKRRN